MTRREVKEFRASIAIRGTVLAALVLWVGIGVVAAFEDDLPTHAFASIAFFVAFFLVFVAYYFSMAFVVHEYGVTYRGATEFVHFDWEDIVKVDLSNVPLGGYTVTTTQGVFVLSSFIKGHQALAELIAARAGLLPVR